MEALIAFLCVISLCHISSFSVWMKVNVVYLHCFYSYMPVIRGNRPLKTAPQHFRNSKGRSLKRCLMHSEHGNIG